MTLAESSLQFKRVTEFGYEHAAIHAIGASMICVIGTAGCLSIGGKTYTTQLNPETENRIAAVESRLGTLEQVVMGSSVSSAYSAATTNTP